MFKSMFKYGRKAGVMGVITLVLAVIPILVVLLVVMPMLGDSIPLKFDEAGEAVRWGSKWEILVAPVLTLGLGLGTISSGFKQARKFNREPAMEKATFERFMRNGVMGTVVLFAASAYMIFTAVTGHGIAF